MSFFLFLERASCDFHYMVTRYKMRILMAKSIEILFTFYALNEYYSKYLPKIVHDCNEINELIHILFQLTQIKHERIKLTTLQSKI